MLFLIPTWARDLPMGLRWQQESHMALRQGILCFLEVQPGPSLAWLWGRAQLGWLEAERKAPFFLVDWRRSEETRGAKGSN